MSNRILINEKAYFRCLKLRITAMLLCKYIKHQKLFFQKAAIFHKRNSLLNKFEFCLSNRILINKRIYFRSLKLAITIAMLLWKYTKHQKLFFFSGINLK